MLESIGQAFLALELDYVEQFVAALLPMSLTVVIHGYGMKFAGRYFRRFGAPVAKASELKKNEIAATLRSRCSSKCDRAEPREGRGRSACISSWGRARRKRSRT